MTQPIELARQAANRAIEIDEAIADAHTALGLIHLSYDWRWRDAERAFDRAIELDPRSGTARIWLGFWHMSRGDGERALIETRRAAQLEPNSLIIQTQLGWMLCFNRRYAGALDQHEKTLATDPHFWRAYMNAAWCYMATERYDDAVHSMEMAFALSDYPLVRTILAHTLVLAGRKGKATTLLAEIESSERHASPYYLAQAWLALGEVETAARLLVRSSEEREWFLIFMRADPGLDQLRTHATYREVVDRMAF